MQGRQANIWKSAGYIPQDVVELGGAATKQVSRALEYAFGDFALSQVAKLLNKTADGRKYAQRAGNFVNHWSPNVTVPDVDEPLIVGMMQPRFSNGSFGSTDPRHCSVNDPTHSTCFLFNTNFDGFYESSPLVVRCLSLLIERPGVCKLTQGHGSCSTLNSRLMTPRSWSNCRAGTRPSSIGSTSFSTTWAFHHAVSQPSVHH